MEVVHQNTPAAAPLLEPIVAPPVKLEESQEAENQTWGDKVWTSQEYADNVTFTYSDLVLLVSASDRIEEICVDERCYEVPTAPTSAAPHVKDCSSLLETILMQWSVERFHTQQSQLCTSTVWDQSPLLARKDSGVSAPRFGINCAVLTSILLNIVESAVCARLF